MAKRNSISADLHEQAAVQVSDFHITNFERTFGMEFPAHLREDLTFDKLIAWRLIVDAAAGNSKSIQEYLDRKYGKPKQTNVNENHNMDYTSFLKELRDTAPPPTLLPISASPDLFDGVDG